MADGYTDQNAVFNAVNLEALTHQLKYEDQSPTSKMGFSFSRASSTGSVHISSSASSAQNSDEDDSGDAMNHSDNSAYRERRREAHTEAERKRREAIKKGYDELQDIVPSCHNNDSVSSAKMSKAVILQRSIDYIQHLHGKRKDQETTLDKLRKEVMALKIMKANYEHIVKAHQSSPQTGHNQVSDEVKFQVFQTIMDTLFQSFNGTISVASFAELSGCVFSWLEECCQPQLLKEMTTNILRQVTSQMGRD